MKLLKALQQIFLQEDINFLLTNRLPRRWATLLMGRLSRLEQPLLRDLSLLLWQCLGGLDLSDAEKTHFRSLHDCFTRALRAGARPADVDPGILTSPCDAIVGACGAIDGTQVFQAKGFPYTLEELLNDDATINNLRDGVYVTLRITANMYHRFHAPHDVRVSRVTYFSGDTWNVNPVALKRVEKLFCKNERAALVMHAGPAATPLVLVPVAAILVAGIRLHFLDTVLNLRYRGANVIDCDATLRKGDEMGWFEHGSTILVFAPRGSRLCDGVETGRTIRAGQRLLHLPVTKP